MEKSKKRLAFLLSICFVVFSYFAVRTLISQTSLSHPAPLLVFKDADIKQIVLTGTSRSQTVVRKNGSWVVPKDGTDYPADAEKVTDLLKLLHGVTGETVVSRNKAKFAEFSIGKQNITLETKTGKYTLFVGGNYLANDVYARFGNRSEVFIARDLGAVNIEEDIRDLKLPLIGNPGDVQSLQIDFENDQTLLVKSGNTWHTDETPVADTAVERYLEDLAGLRGHDMFPRPLEPSSTPDLTVVAKGKSTVKAVHFYSYNEQSLLADIEGAPYIYAVDRAFVAALEKKKTDFISPTIQP